MLGAIVVAGAIAIFAAIAISKSVGPMTVDVKATPAPAPGVGPDGTSIPRRRSGSPPTLVAGRWSKPIALGRPRPKASTAIAVNARGQAIAAWTAPDGLRVAKGNASGFGNSVVVGQGSRPAVAIDSLGNSYLLWTGLGTQSIFVPHGGSLRHAQPQRLSRGGGQLGVNVVATPVSGAVAAWREDIARGLIPVVATAKPGAPLGNVKSLADPTPVVNLFDQRTGLAAGKDGTAAVAWPSAIQGQSIASYHLFASSGTTFGAGFDRDYRVADDSTSDQAGVTVGPKGQIVVVWIRYDDINVPPGFPHRSDPHISYSYMGEHGFGDHGEGPPVAGTHFLFDPQAFVDAKDKLVVVWTNNDGGSHAGPLYFAGRPDGGEFSATQTLPARSRSGTAKDLILRDNGNGAALLAWEANPDSRSAKFRLAGYNGAGFAALPSPKANPVSNGLGINNRDFAAGGRYGALIWQQRGGPIKASIFRGR